MPLPPTLTPKQFVGDEYDSDHSINRFLYSTPNLWCKYLPACPQGSLYLSPPPLPPPPSPSFSLHSDPHPLPLSVSIRLS
jgi:hypothetical protein